LNNAHPQDIENDNNIRRSRDKRSLISNSNPQKSIFNHNDLEITEEKIYPDDSSKEIIDYKVTGNSKKSRNSKISKDSKNSYYNSPSILNTNEEVVFAVKDLSENQSLPLDSPERVKIDFYSFEKKKDSPEKGVEDIDKEDDKDEELVIILSNISNIVAK
jgi:hypothetical protein